MKPVLLLALLLLVISCRKQQATDCGEKTNNMEKVKALLPGTYTWAYTRVWARGNQPFIETPVTIGYTYKYTFDPNGSVSIYKNGRLESVDRYVVDYEFRVSTYPSDSATMVIISDGQTGQRKEYFRPWLCQDSARFFNPYNSIDYQRYFKRN